MKLFLLLTIISILLGGLYGYASPLPIRHTRAVSVLPLVSPTSTPTPSPSPKPYEIIKKISDTWKDAPSQDIVTAIAISHCESNFHINSKNSTSTASGLYQFLSSTWIRVRNWMGENTDLSLRFNPDENIRTAYALYTLRKERGLNPWTEWECYQKI